MSNPSDNTPRRVIADHRRQWRDFLYVYPVVSRRARGLSIGVNLNPDKRCNFACLYCQVDRHIRRDLHEVRLDVLEDELRQTLAAAASGEIWQEERFAATPGDCRRLNDIAFSGDGEPTCLEQFDQAVARAARVKAQMGLDTTKIVVITNATQLDSPQVARALPILDAANGEFWIKLDAGTEEYFQLVDRPHPKVTLDQIVGKILPIAQGRPIVIQTLLLSVDGQVPPAAEVEAYCNRLAQIASAGGQIKLVQLHTIARTPQSTRAQALSNDELDRLALAVRQRLPGLPVDVYYGRS